MKKVLFLVFFTVTAFFSNAQIGDKININDKFGFLEFGTTSECNAFIKSLVGKSHEEVRKFCSEIKFNSLGISKFENAGSEEVVDENQAAIYSLNADGVVGLDKAALKFVGQTNEIDAWKEALIIKTEILDEKSYKDFASGEFNLELMSKLFLGFDPESDLTSFINKNSQGYISPASGESRRPFWGTGTVHHKTTNGCTYDCNQNYIFWIATGDEYGCTEPVCLGSF